MLVAKQHPEFTITPDRQWFAIYMLPRHEKRVLLQLHQRSVECFLPMYDAVRRWKTGPARVSLPLFPGYLFAHVDRTERRSVIELASVLKIVGTTCGPTAVADCEIEQLRKTVASGLAKPHPYLTIGSRVRITSGPLTDMEGVLVRRKGCMKLVVSLELIMQSVAVEVNSCDIEPCAKPRRAAA